MFKKSQFGVLLFISCGTLLISDLGIDFVLGNEITPNRYLEQGLGLLSYCFAYRIWFKTRINALIPMGLTALAMAMIKDYGPSLASLFVGSIAVPLIGSLVCYSVFRAIFRLKLGRANWFERR